MNTQSPNRSMLAWRKSSYSSANGQCIEVAFHNGKVAVRDSKHPEPEMWFGGVEFRTLAALAYTV